MHLDLELGPRHHAEHRGAKRRIHRVTQALLDVAPLHAQELVPLAQHLLGVVVPLRDRRVVPGQRLGALQAALHEAPHFAGGGDGHRIGPLLGAGLLVAQRQAHQQRLRHQQQRDQRAPQQPAHAAAARRLGGRGGGRSGRFHRAVGSMGAARVPALSSFAHAPRRPAWRHWLPRPASVCATLRA
jgi:hypothetical protein